MHFPLLKDISITDVVTINRQSSVADALEHVINNHHRNIIIKDNDEFYILTVLDILKLQSKHKDLDIPLADLKMTKIPTINKEKNILEALGFIQNSIEYICVIDENHKIYGLVTHTDIISHIDPDILMDNYRLRDFLKMGIRMKWVTKDTNTAEILEEMSLKKYDNIVVVEDKKPIGILTTKDVITMISKHQDFNQPVEHFMSTPVETINNSASVKDALEFIREKHYKRIIVINDKNHLSGVISQKELITLTYSKWSMLMKEYQEELSEINHMLEVKNKQFEKMASKDSLTGLYNRNKFTELYLSTYKTMMQRQQPLSLMILDLDHFKAVNDTHGHNVGDAVLIQTSHILIRQLRNIDVICRWGGEEFVVLLPTADIDKTLKIAEKLRQNIAENELELVGHITVSIGVASVQFGDSLEDVVGRADCALYKAKSDGRNCVKIQ